MKSKTIVFLPLMFFYCFILSGSVIAGESDSLKHSKISIGIHGGLSTPAFVLGDEETVYTSYAKTGFCIGANSYYKIKKHFRLNLGLLYNYNALDIDKIKTIYFYAYDKNSTDFVLGEAFNKKGYSSIDLSIAHSIQFGRGRNVKVYFNPAIGFTYAMSAKLNIHVLDKSTQSQVVFTQEYYTKQKLAITFLPKIEILKPVKENASVSLILGYRYFGNIKQYYSYDGIKYTFPNLNGGGSVDYYNPALHYFTLSLGYSRNF